MSDDRLEAWTLWLRDALIERGAPAQVMYDDRVGGDVLVLVIAGQERDRLVEVVVSRRAKDGPRTRGRAYLTALATTAAGAAAASDALERLHHDVSRLANAKRKHVRRITRLVAQLVSSWAARSTVDPPGRALALAEFLEVVPDAVPMYGVGYYGDLDGDDGPERVRFPPAYGVAVPTGSGWRALPWDAAARRWTARPGLVAALQAARPGVDLAAAGITMVGGATVAAFTAASVAPVIERPASSRWDCADSCSPCDLLDLADLVPDCDSCDLDCNF
ncbi:MAG: hypothetical protein R3B06_15890 [Kofleriaceae bacterium]